MNGKGPKANPPAEFIDSPVFKLLHIASMLARPFIETIGPEKDLTLPEWRSMVALYAKGELSNTEIAEHTGLDAMSVSRAQDRLRRNGRVERSRDAADARRQINRLTPAGRTMYRSLVKLAKQRQDAMLGGLSEKDIEVFDATLEHIVQRLRDAG